MKIYNQLKPRKNNKNQNKERLVHTDLKTSNSSVYKAEYMNLCDFTIYEEKRNVQIK